VHYRLSKFDIYKDIYIQTDSSKSGIGCCIFQDDKPIAYASQSLNDHECQWGQVEKEMYAIVYACERFHEYVYGKKVIIYTDHKPLILVMTKELNKIKNNRLRRMKTRLAIYNL